METSIILATKLAVDFAKFSYGVLHAPYVTYRTLARKEDVRLLPFVISLIFIYFGVAGLAKGALWVHPFLLTIGFVKEVAAIILSFMFTITALGVLGGLLGGEVSWRRLIILWAFSLLPTTVWFILASIFSLILPPPRTISVLDQLASGVFISLSVGLLLWKGILYYLTLRFGLKLDLLRIVIGSSIFLPLAGVYALVMYRLEVFKIPFL